MVPHIIEQLQQRLVVLAEPDAGTDAAAQRSRLHEVRRTKHDLKAECLPGPTAFVPALVKSGLPCGGFIFEGFLPHKKGRQTKLQSLAEEERTIIFYESPHRLLKTLQQMVVIFGPDRMASVSRELTKIHEETVNGTLHELIEHFMGSTVKGEFVMVIGGHKMIKQE